MAVFKYLDNVRDSVVSLTSSVKTDARNFAVKQLTVARVTLVQCACFHCVSC